MAVMGSSGSGKTTLLNVLTNRNLDNFKVSGQVTVNGVVVGENIGNISAYVQQDDLFVGILTVREHLWFNALLRMDQRLTDSERNARVDEVMMDLSLTKCENSAIGEPGKVKSISGGERKRLSFATEILTNPKILFCDEPTSGLDSFMAENVVQHLRKMAMDMKKIVVCTIHQPSSEIFKLFDHLTLLSEGQLVFQGPVNDAKQFFAQNGFLCPNEYNPADFLIRTVAIVPNLQIECKEKVELLAHSFKTSEMGRELSRKISEVENNRDHISNVVNSNPSRANFFRQFRCLAWRSVTANYRDVMFVRVRLFQNIFIALFIGLVFFGQQNNQKAVQNINGCLFLFCTNMAFSNAFGVILTFTSGLPLFKREHQNGTYGTSVYFLCRQLADLPLFIINPIIFVSVCSSFSFLFTVQMGVFSSFQITYWMVGLNPDPYSFLICCAVAILLTNSVVSWGYFLSSACAKGDTASVLVGPLTMPFIMFGGFLLNDA